jgi:4-hydroxybenzoate polyprenyltransferase
VRLVHPAPTAAVTALSAALATILTAETGRAIDWSLIALITASVAGSQIFTGATNDLTDQSRDAILRPEKALPAGDLSANEALWIAAGGLALQIGTAARLGALPLVLGLAASTSALAYNVWLSRTPLSVVPYLVSFGLLPVWIAASLGISLERVAPAVVLVAPFAAAAHLANTLRDFEADAALGSRCLAQVLGRRNAQRLAVGLAVGVAVLVALSFFVASRLQPTPVVLGVLGLLAILRGTTDARRLWQGILAAAILWTIAWALASGPAG